MLMHLIVIPMLLAMKRSMMSTQRMSSRKTRNMRKRLMCLRRLQQLILRLSRPAVLLLLQLTGSLAPTVFDSIQKDVAADDGPKVRSRASDPAPTHSTARGPAFARQYSVQLLTGALRMPASTPSVVMTKKGGKKYRCYLPEEGTAGEAASEAEALEAAPSVASYLMPIKGTCFYRLEGWWTYEFCFLKSVRQFHQEKV